MARQARHGPIRSLFGLLYCARERRLSRWKLSLRYKCVHKPFNPAPPTRQTIEWASSPVTRCYCTSLYYKLTLLSVMMIPYLDLGLHTSDSTFELECTEDNGAYTRITATQYKHNSGSYYSAPTTQSTPPSSYQSITSARSAEGSFAS